MAALSPAFANPALAASTISVDFQGRSSAGTNAPVTALAATEVAGVVPVANWNSVDDAYGVGLAEFAAAEKGTTQPLVDSEGAVTPVTLTFDANDSWNNDVDLSTNVTANAKMMNGVIKQQGANTAATFTFNNVPDAQYDIYIYTDSNNDNVAMDISDLGGAQTLYTIGTHQFLDTDSFVEATNTNPSGPRDVGNYVKLSSVPTYGSPTLGFTATYISGGDGLGIAGIQLVEVGGPVPPPLLDFQFNEGQGTNTVDSANGLVGVLGIGMGIDPGNVPVIVTNSPAGTEGDRALSLNAGNPTSQAGLIVNDKIAPILAFATNAPFTMEAWVNRETGDTRQYEGVGAYGRSYKMGFNNGEFLFTLFGIVDIYSGIVPATGEWHHLAAVWQPGTGVEFFLDGTSVTNVAETRVPRDYQNNILTIGAENVSANGLAVAFQGLIDRFRVHGAALTADDLDSVAATPKAALPSTVVAYDFNAANYPFASAGAIGRPAVPNSSPAWTSDTPTGLDGDYALSFAPGTQVVVNDPDGKVALDPADPSFTMQAWVNLEGNPATRQVFYFNNGPGGALSFSIFTNRTVFVTTLGILDQSSNAAIPDDGNWHHIAVVHENGTEFRFYVDGALADTQPYTGGVNFTRTDEVFYLGSEPTFGLQYTGMLDRLKVTKGVLTAEELDFPAGGNPPGIVSVGAINGGIGITFNGPVTLATATNIANYAVSGATITEATLFGGNYVALTLSAALTNDFTLTVNNIATPGGDIIPSEVTITGQVSDLTSVDVGEPGVNPAQPGYAVALGDGGYIVAGGGNDIYNNADAFRFVYKEFTGAFDVRTRVESMNPIGAGSTWAKAGLMVRETLAPGSRNVHLHVTRADGQNGIYMTWRDALNGATTSSDPALRTPVPYPDAWIRLVRPDATTNVFNSYTSTNGVNWEFELSHTITGTNVPETVLLGMTVTSHNDNNDLAIPLAEAVFQDFSVDAFPSQPARPYSIGLNFGANAVTGAALDSSDVAGVPEVAQANWNNLNGAAATNITDIVAEAADEVGESTEVSVTYFSNGLWSSTGQGEENNVLPGADFNLMAGYMDMNGNDQTSTVTITNIPVELTSGGYDVYVYAMGGVGGRGGAYRILDAGNQQVLFDYVRAQSPTNATSYVEVPTSGTDTNYVAGNYMVFSGLTAPAITVEATTAGGFGFSGTPRAPINAIQLVGASEVDEGPALSVERTAEGLSITFEGTLESADEVTGPWTPVEGASPLLVTPSGDAQFYRARQ